MKHHSAKNLTEKSKYSKSADRDKKPIKYDNFNTPNNHRPGKTSRVIDGKVGLGKEPGSHKTVVQTKKPKKKERRTLSEEQLNRLYELWNSRHSEKIHTNRFVPVSATDEATVPGDSEQQYSYTPTGNTSWADSPAGHAAADARTAFAISRGVDPSNPESNMTPMGPDAAESPLQTTAAPVVPSSSMGSGVAAPAVQSVSGINPVSSTSVTGYQQSPAANITPVGGVATGIAMDGNDDQPIVQVQHEDNEYPHLNNNQDDVPTNKNDFRGLENGSHKMNIKKSEAPATQLTTEDDTTDNIFKGSKQRRMPRMKHIMDEDIVNNIGGTDRNGDKHHDVGSISHLKDVAPKMGKIGHVKDMKHGTTNNDVAHHNVGQVRKLPRDYSQARTLKVDTVTEALADIEQFLGSYIALSDTLAKEIFEDFPEDFGQDSFSNGMSTKKHDAAHEEAFELMKDSVKSFLHQHGNDFIRNYMKQQDNPDEKPRTEIITRLARYSMDAAQKGINAGGYDFQADTAVVSQMVIGFLQNAGIPDDDAIRAFEHMHEPVGEMSSGGAVGSGSIASTTQPMKGVRRRDSLFAGGNITAPPISGGSGNITAPPISGGSGNITGGTSAGSQMPSGDIDMNTMTEDWGSSDWSTVIKSMDEDMERMGGVTPDSIEEAAHNAAEFYFDQMGYDSPEEAVDRIIYMYNKRSGASKFSANEDFIKPTNIDHIQQSVEKYIAELDPYMEKKYFLTWAEASGNRRTIEQAIQHGMTPKEFADAWADKHGLDVADGGWNQ